MVAVLQRKEEYKTKSEVRGTKSEISESPKILTIETTHQASYFRHQIQHIVVLKGSKQFIFKKGCPINFLRFFTDRTPLQKKSK